MSDLNIKYYFMNFSILALNMGVLCFINLFVIKVLEVLLKNRVSEFEICPRQYSLTLPHS